MEKTYVITYEYTRKGAASGDSYTTTDTNIIKSEHIE